MSDVILALNAGSSSLKFGLFDCAGPAGTPRPIATGVARSGSEGSYEVEIGGMEAALQVDQMPGHMADDFVPWLIGWIADQPHFGRLAAVGHRIVHGGTRFGDPVVIDDRVLKQIEALSPLAPLHQQASIAPVRQIGDLMPGLAQIACFDTAFHRTIRPPAGRYALPRKYEVEGIRHYGFHGLSFESVAAQLKRDGGPSVSKERVIIAHLGSGASLCALRELQSVDTTMGFSTLDGLVMGTRPGALDAGILLYLMKEEGLSADRLERLLYRESGLLGVSGISSDIKRLLETDAPSAREALELFAFQAARQTAALAATLGGLDRFVFTGGVGENSAKMRSMIVDRLGLFGAKLDEGANVAGDTRFSCDESAILIEKRATQEEQVIAAHTAAIVADPPELESGARSQ